MKNLLTVLFVLFSFYHVRAVATSPIDYCGSGIAPYKHCIKVGIFFGGSSSNVSLCCTFSTGTYSVHCGFEREIVPNVTFAERMYLEEWRSLVNSVTTDSRSESGKGYVVEVAEDTNVDFLETDDYQILLLRGRYRFDKDGVVECNFKKVMKQ